MKLQAIITYKSPHRKASTDSDQDPSGWVLTIKHLHHGKCCRTTQMCPRVPTRLLSRANNSVFSSFSAVDYKLPEVRSALLPKLSVRSSPLPPQTIFVVESRGGFISLSALLAKTIMLQSWKSDVWKVVKELENGSHLEKIVHKQKRDQLEGNRLNWLFKWLVIGATDKLISHYWLNDWLCDHSQCSHVCVWCFLKTCNVQTLIHVFKKNLNSYWIFLSVFELRH